MNATNGDAATTGRPRAESSTSTGMDIVEDEEKDGADQEEEAQSPDTKRYPARLHGRGGFGRPILGDGRGVKSSTPSSRAVPFPPVDPMDNLTAGMSALQFVPPSVRLAQTRGRGRGG